MNLTLIVTVEVDPGEYERMEIARRKVGLQKRPAFDHVQNIIEDALNRKEIVTCGANLMDTNAEYRVLDEPGKFEAVY